MPFDALVAVESPKLLTDALADCQLTPVDLETLAAHKQAQLEKFGPSFWFRHQNWLAACLMGSIGFMALTGGLANAVTEPPSPVPMYVATIWMCLLAALIFCGVVRVRAGSRWEERWLPPHMLAESGVPEPIAAAARMLQREIPGSTLVLGELIQESVLLDPYLLLVHRDQRICLGIWDGDTIVARCQQESPAPSAV
jgi:hypothetical protein